MNSVPVAGIDVSKDFSDMCILAPDNTIFAQVKIFHDKVSMERSLDFLTKAEEQFGKCPVLIMEATGHYHRLLWQFMQRSGYEASVINPIQSNAIKNINVRKIKNDKIDAHRIALLYRLQAIKPTNIPNQAITCLRALCRQHYDLKNDMVSYANRLTAHLDQVFPGYSKIFYDIIGSTSLTILSCWPSPQMILEVPTATLTRTIRTAAHKSKEYSCEKSRLLKETAKSALAVGVCHQASDMLIQTVVSMLLSLAQAVKQTDSEIQKTVTEAPELKHNVELLKSIPGIADYSAAVILSEIGEFSAFQKPKQLVAFFGIDPSERQSGKFVGTKNKIFKRGSRHLRKILNMVAIANSFPLKNGTVLNPVMAAYYEKKAVSKPHKVVICAVMHKLVNIIFAVLRDQTPFEIRQPEEHRKMMLKNTLPNHAA